MSLVDRWGILGHSIALCLDETSMLSPVKDMDRGTVPAGVRTPKDALRCALKTCRCVSIVGANVSSTGPGAKLNISDILSLKDSGSSPPLRWYL